MTESGLVDHHLVHDDYRLAIPAFAKIKLKVPHHRIRTALRSVKGRQGLDWTVGIVR